MNDNVCLEERLKEEQENRHEILNTFEYNILIEAGAGAGKTTLIVERLIQQIKTTELQMDQIVVITFTEKAAEELKGRFQQKLYQAQKDEKEDEKKQKLTQAVNEMDKIQISTIHSFCNRMLLEMPFEAGFGMDMSIIQGQELEEKQKNFFLRFCKDCAGGYDFGAIGIKAEQLFVLFQQMCNKKDVEWVYDKSVNSNTFDSIIESIIKSTNLCLCEIKDSLEGSFKKTEIKAGGSINGSDPVIKEETIACYQYILNHASGIDYRGVELLNKIKVNEGKTGVTVSACVSRDSKEKAYEKNALEKSKKVYADLKNKDIGKDMQEIKQAWPNYCHALCMSFLEAACVAYQKQMKEENVLDHDDLLYYTRKMLLDSEIARDYFKNKFQYFYIDEFQDTDAIQVDILYLLTGKEQQGTWERDKVEFEPAKFCLVGDPKQSIYGFRGADIKQYNLVKKQMKKQENACKIYYLHQNFRSDKNVCDWINATFQRQNNSVFGFESCENAEQSQAKGESCQAGFDGILCDKKEKTGNKSVSGVESYHIKAEGENQQQEIVRADAEYVSDIIEKMVGKEEIEVNDELRKVCYSDFLILTWNTLNISTYVTACKKKGIPVSVAGNIKLENVEEVSNLLCLLDYFTDTGNKFKLAMVLNRIFGWDLKRTEEFDYHKKIWKEETLDDSNSAISTLHEWMEKRRKLSPMQFVELLVDDLQLLMGNKIYDSKEVAYAYGNLELCMETIRESAYGTLEDIYLLLKNMVNSKVEVELSIKNEQNNAVRIMNLHKAKGLEGNIVILADPAMKYNKKTSDILFHEKNAYTNLSISYENSYANENKWLCKNIGKSNDYEKFSKEAEDRLEEERIRLLYVACTRAKNALMISTSNLKNKGRGWDKNENYTAWEVLLENNVIENNVVENDAIENDAVENDAVENDAVENDAIENKVSSNVNAQNTIANVSCMTTDENDAEEPKVHQIQNNLEENDCLGRIFDLQDIPQGIEETIQKENTRIKFVIANPSHLEKGRKVREQEQEKEILEVADHLSAGDNTLIQEKFEASKAIPHGNMYGTILHKMFEQVVLKAHSLLRENKEPDGITDPEWNCMVNAAVEEGMACHVLNRTQCKNLSISNPENVMNKSEQEQKEMVQKALCENLIEHGKKLLVDSEMMDEIKGAKNIYTELPFAMTISSERAMQIHEAVGIKNYEEGQEVFVNGVMDLLLEFEDGYYVIWDYKSNCKKQDETIQDFETRLQEEYETQLAMYEEALRQFALDTVKNVEKKLYHLYRKTK